MTRSELIERQCDNFATGCQDRRFLRGDHGDEPEMRELLRLNLEQFHRSVSGELAAEREAMETELAGLKRAAQQMLVAIRGGVFIIPNKGNERDRSIAAFDGLLAALGMKPGDLAMLSPIATHRD